MAKIFVVDDNKMFIGNFIEEVVPKLSSHEVTTFTCPEEVLDLLENPNQTPPDLLVTDMKFPGYPFDGYELISALCEKSPRAKIIIFSGLGHAITEVVDKLVAEYGKNFDEVKGLTKTSDNEYLASVIHGILSSTRPTSDKGRRIQDILLTGDPESAESVFDALMGPDLAN